LTNGNRAHPHLIKLADRAIDLMKKYTGAATAASGIGAPGGKNN
jgi:hypothetical protein